MVVVKACKFCSEDFESYKSENKEFCNKECYSKWRSENIRGKDHPNYKGGYEQRKCSICGEKFKARHYTDTKTCSRNCKYDLIGQRNSGESNPIYKERIALKCQYCEENFKVLPRKKDQKFCSIECSYRNRKDLSTKEQPHYQGKRRKLECEWCGNNYEVKETKADSSRFCDKECYDEWQKTRTGKKHPLFEGGRNTYYGSNWKEMRRKTLKRDNYECVVCKRGKNELGRNPSVHHIKPLKKFDNPKDANYLDNLVTLCAKHHQKVEGWGLLPTNYR